jgi:hypothetical protein
MQNSTPFIHLYPFPQAFSFLHRQAKSSLSVSFILVFMSLVTLPVRAANILFVARDRQTGTPGTQMNEWEDPVYLNRLTNVLGHTVIIIPNSSATVEPATTNDWQTNGPIDMVFISGSVSSGAIESAFRECTVPVIGSENGILDNGGLGEGYNANENDGSIAWGELSGNTTLVITDPAHPMAAGFSGTITVYSNSSPGRFNFVKPNSHMQIVATQAGFPNRAVICGYEEGSPMFGLIAPARRVSLFLPETDVTNATPNAWTLFDASIAWALGAPPAPKVRNLSPVNGAVFFSPAGGISFNVTSSPPVNPGAIRLTLNGFDESDNLMISGDPTNRSVTFSGLNSNRFYNAEISVSNGLGSRIQRLRFDTFREADAVTIEAEDYNYASGQFQDDPVPPAYANQTGTAGIDYSDVSVFPSHPGADLIYRPGDDVGTRPLSWLNHNDVLRSKFVTASVPDYYVRYLTNGDWMNYTRNLPGNSYNIYLRADTMETLQVNFDQVTSDATQGSQTTAPVGSFVIEDSENGGFRYAPLKNNSGNLVALNLSGTNTFRLTDVNSTPVYHPGLGLNYLLFLPTSVQPPPVQTSLLSPHMQGGNFIFSFATSVGRRYSVQYKDSLSQPSWTTLTSFNGLGTTTSITNAASSSSRFFRVGVY